MPSVAQHHPRPRPVRLFVGARLPKGVSNAPLPPALPSAGNAHNLLTKARFGNILAGTGLTDIFQHP